MRDEGRGGIYIYIMARRTSAVGMTPSFSPSMGSEKRLKASRMSASSCAEMLFSLASLDCRALGALLLAVVVVSAGGRRRGGWRKVTCIS